MIDLTPYALKVPHILLPAAGTDLKSWAVVACDQYTQDRAYWSGVASARAGKPSTLDLIFPEVYLDDEGKAERIAAIQDAMRDYLARDVFASPFIGMVYVERTTSYGRTRSGLVAAVDLDAYDWHPGSTSLIRATEQTVPERLPPRMEIRRGAPLELPHVMLLVNDADRVLVEGAGNAAKKGPPLYDTDLMLDGGHLTGWPVTGSALESIASAAAQVAAKNTGGGKVFMFAVGDGNHSLATAKAVWEEYKAAHPNEDLRHHNARYALAEIVNIYDSGLTFEPIHRVLFHVDAEDLAAVMKSRLSDTVTLKEKVISITPEDGAPLSVVKVQPLLESYLASHKEAAIDYIHGDDEVWRLVKSGSDIAGVLLPPIAKESFFFTINAGGTLPRKSFSMGEASEKRFYFESRSLYV